MYARVWKQGILHDRYPVSDVRSVPVLSVPNRVQVLGPIFVKFILINPFPDTDLALWGNLCSVPSVLFSEVSSDYSKWCWVILNMCGNTNSHIFRGSCKVRNELSFPRIIYPGLSGDLSEAGDKLSEKLFSSPNVPISCSTCVTTFVHTYFMTFVKFWEGRTFVGCPRITYPGTYPRPGISYPRNIFHVRENFLPMVFQVH